MWKISKVKALPPMCSTWIRRLESILMHLQNVDSFLRYTCELAVDYYLTGHILPAAKFNILLSIAVCESQSIGFPNALGTRC